MSTNDARNFVETVLVDDPDVDFNTADLDAFEALGGDWKCRIACAIKYAICKATGGDDCETKLVDCVAGC